MNDFATNIYEKIFVKDIIERAEGSFVIIAGTIVSLNIREKAIFFQSNSIHYFFCNLYVLVDDSTDTIECILFASSSYFPDLVQSNFFTHFHI